MGSETDSGGIRIYLYCCASYSLNEPNTDHRFRTNVESTKVDAFEPLGLKELQGIGNRPNFENLEISGHRTLVTSPGLIDLLES